MESQLGKELRALRFEHKMKLFEMAKIAGLVPANLSSIEHGRREMPDESVFRISKALGLSPQKEFQLLHLADMQRKEFKICADFESETQKIAASFISRFMKTKRFDDEKAYKLIEIIKSETAMELA